MFFATRFRQARSRHASIVLAALGRGPPGAVALRAVGLDFGEWLSDEDFVLKLTLNPSGASF